mgnify:CR=1 FL=1
MARWQVIVIGVAAAWTVKKGAQEGVGQGRRNGETSHEQRRQGPASRAGTIGFPEKSCAWRGRRTTASTAGGAARRGEYGESGGWREGAVRR